MGETGLFTSILWRRFLPHRANLDREDLVNLPLRYTRMMLIVKARRISTLLLRSIEVYTYECLEVNIVPVVLTYRSYRFPLVGS